MGRSNRRIAVRLRKSGSICMANSKTKLPDNWGRPDRLGSSGSYPTLRFTTQKRMGNGDHTTMLKCWILLGRIEMTSNSGSPYIVSHFRWKCCVKHDSPVFKTLQSPAPNPKALAKKKPNYRNHSVSWIHVQLGNPGTHRLR